uniref:Uncharacterized protein n=1 Tax=Lotus japonicus TaxID=34305 RepID=I3SS94_LOTJA|nr:unknown [Lotus japonicus]
MSTSFCTVNSDSGFGFESILLASAAEMSATAAMENQSHPTKFFNTICNTYAPK